MSGRDRSSDLAKQATFVFEGTVRKLRTATVPDVPVDDRTAVVHVDRVAKAPAALAGYGGQDITVQLGPGAALKRGQRAVFYTEGGLFGESLAVRSLGHTDVGRTTSAEQSRDPVQEKTAHDLEAHVADADLVVRGRVARVRVPTASLRRPRGPVSEHAPRWQEAVVDVDEVGKGRSPRKQVVVWFPSSTDVRWARAPKLHAGQEGVFLLHKGDAPAYTALHAQDVQPPHAAEEVLALARSQRAPRRPRPAPGRARPAPGGRSGS